MNLLHLFLCGNFFNSSETLFKLKLSTPDTILNRKGKGRQSDWNEVV